MAFYEWGQAIRKGLRLILFRNELALGCSLSAEASTQKYYDTTPPLPISNSNCQHRRYTSIFPRSSEFYNDAGQGRQAAFIAHSSGMI